MFCFFKLEVSGYTVKNIPYVMVLAMKTLGPQRKGTEWEGQHKSFLLPTVPESCLQSLLMLKQVSRSFRDHNSDAVCGYTERCDLREASS